MFIIQEQPVCHDVLIGGAVSTDDNESTIVGSPVDTSYTVQDTSVSEVEISFVNPTYSPIRFSDDDCACPQQTVEVNSTSCCAMEINADHQNATNLVSDVSKIIPVNDTYLYIHCKYW